MDAPDRDDVIDEYFDAIDAEEYDRLEAVFADDVEYHYFGGKAARGVDEAIALLGEERSFTNTTHTTSLRLHDGRITVCEGTVEGELVDGGGATVDFMDRMEFDADGLMGYVKVYLHGA